MTVYDAGQQQRMDDFTEKVNNIMDLVLELSLIHNCRIYFLVDYDKGILTFNSVEDRSWPPPDRTLGCLNRPIRRVYSSQEILRRITEEERKELIQLLVYISEVTKGPPAMEASQIQSEEERGQNLDPKALLGSRADSEDYELDIEGGKNLTEIEGDENEQGSGRGDDEIDEGEEADRYKAFMWDGDTTYPHISGTNVQ
ncbi:hypothetical protein EYZ11_006003 [Aspergillus tanneri]|uniref:Uncharacterized protein n=1 Tax=Aspergillus tanneri TaxID=1220188 RepID=A0A4S3JMI3_9EURO|nr:uncharacterized protein ATNIH1004_011303 [Aspergillus tanneri]KAA8642359.1 hypothetical protein ATNIH1004_011303 [Aspergillus tanneri]THC94521.1 hypothetical protein EYZ11_006003 [Aspergillus tanneri]